MSTRTNPPAPPASTEAAASAGRGGSPSGAEPLGCDVAVIGAGPGGYVAAIRAAQLGLETVCIDRWTDGRGRPALGGTCLNVGCIPSKALLDSSHHFHQLQHLLPDHGISVEGARVDVAVMQARKRRVVSALGRGVAGLLRKNRVELLTGTARLIGAAAGGAAAGAAEAGTRVEVEVRSAGAPPRRLRPRHVVIAAGSLPIALPAAPVDGERIVDSEGALAFEETPPRLGIIGAGVIGLELGSVWSRLGAEVVLLEALDDFLPAADRDVAGEALRILRRQGLDVRLGKRVTGCDTGGGGPKGPVAVRFEDADGAHRLEVDRLVVAVGRRPATGGLGLAELGVERDERGFVRVDEHGRTSRENVWAIGDCTPGPMLAHRASEDGIAVAERIAGQASRIDHRTVPWVIYTHPEIAWVGRTEAELDAAGIEWRAGRFPFAASGRALAAGEAEGFAKVVCDEGTDEIHGVHVIGAQASELVAEAVTAMEFRASAEDLARTIHAHPTRAEVLHEAALAVDERAIHV